MAIYIGEEDVTALVGMDDAVAALDGAFRHWGTAETANLARRRLPLPGSVYQVMAAALPADDVFGAKLYYVLPGGRNFMVLLHSLSEGRLLAMIEADWMSQLRTGAATGLAARHLARPDASRAAVIGAGTQARAQLMALHAVRPLEGASVFSPTPDRRETFARSMSENLEIPVTAAGSIEACIDGADMIVTITSASEPVLTGEMLSSGTFVSAAGANRLAKREIDTACFARAGAVVVDDREQAEAESGEIAAAVEEGAIGWARIAELGELVTGRAAGRSAPGEITLFKSLGIALEDVAIANLVYRRALEAGRGRPIPVGDG